MLRFLLLTCIVGYVSAASIFDGQTSLANGHLFNSHSKSCQIEGKSYPSETIVPREHPCHYCVCHEGKVACYWKHCAQAPVGCKVMDFQDTCNPSLYICGIPESVRESPNQQPSVTALLAAESKTPVPATSNVSASVIRQTTASPQTEAIEPPTRHLTPPDPTAFPPRGTGSEPARQARVETKGKQPSEFSLRTKHKMRFTRSAFYDVEAKLPYGIQEEFPIDLNRELPRAVVESIRQKRAILGFAEHHHHHHDHPEEPLDRGCVILGVRYDVGDVIGIATDVCQECRCAAQALFCSPKCCFNPAPLRQLTGDDINSLMRSTSEITQQRVVPHPLHSFMSQS